MTTIRERDAAVRYCGTCGNTYYPGDQHDRTLAECEGALGTDPNRSRDPETGSLCWDPKVHHPYVPGEIPDYAPDEGDRRALLQAIDPVIESLMRVDAQPLLVERLEALIALIGEKP